MSARRSRPGQPTSTPSTASARSAGTRLAGSPPGAHPGRLPPIPLVLALLLGGLLWVMLSGAHLASAERLAPWLGPSPVRALSPSRTGKLLVFAGLAALTGGVCGSAWKKDPV